MGYEMLLEVWFWDLLLFKLQLPYLVGVLGFPLTLTILEAFPAVAVDTCGTTW